MSEEENKELHEAAGGEETPGKPDPSGSPATGSSGEAGEAGEVDKRVKTEEAENPVTGTGEKVEGPEAGPADADDSEKEIDDSNAEDAEDSENERRHQIPFLDYHALSMENLVGELQRLLRTEKVQAIRRHVDGIKQEFDQKFQEFIEQKKEEFVDRGGNEADFRYNSVTKRQFNELYAEYREKRNQYYKELEQNLRKNLTIRQEPQVSP